MTARGARVRLPAVSEKAFQAQVVKLARTLGYRVYFTWRSFHSPRGWVDLVLLRPPVALFVELKTERGKLSPEQVDCLTALRACGLDARVWRPGDAQEIASTLHGLKP